MDSNAGPITVRARWLFPVGSTPIRDGQLVIQNGQIVEIGRRTSAREERDGRAEGEWEDVAVFPALINAHTHLEFSDLRQPIGSTCGGFADWVRQVVFWRRKRGDVSLPAIRSGLAESLASGTAAVGEIATSPLSVAAIASAPAFGVVFLELIGLRSERVARQLALAREFLLTASRCDNLRPGISPHAPYTVHPRLLEGAIGLSREFGCPVAMHLAESADEIELLRNGTGPFVALLEELNAWDPAAIPADTRPKDYLELLVACPKSLVIHGNYLQADELALMAQHVDRMTLVYCPRTHAFFGHDACPVEEAINHGVRLALGTDSRASNPDLSLWKELQFAVRQHSAIAPERWLEIATLHGAAACGWENHLGTLAVGKRASFVAVGVPADLADRPWDLLADERCEVRHVAIAGW